jgi:hypothetical protein
MKKIIGFTFSILLLVACGSKKGAWTEEEKEKAIQSLEKHKAEIEAFGKDKQAFIDCYVEKMEQRYENFDASTEAGRNLVVVDCIKPIVQKSIEKSKRNFK